MRRRREEEAEEEEEEEEGIGRGRISAGRLRGYPGGRPAAKTSVMPSKYWKNKHFGTDVHDAKARTSVTPGGSKKKTSARKTSG